MIQDHVCFAEKTSYQLFKLFSTRYELFKTVYSHKASVSIEYMVCDAFKAANHVFRITDKVHDAKSFMKLTDNILTAIQHADIDKSVTGWEGVIEAQEIINRIQRRDLYKCCGYLLLSAEEVAQFNPKQSSTVKARNDSGAEDSDLDLDQKEAVQSHQEVADDNVNSATPSHPKIAYRDIMALWRKELYATVCDLAKENRTKNTPMDLEQSDLIIQLMSLSFGKETNHPMELAHFYSSTNPKAYYAISAHQVTTLSDHFREVVVRAYVKKPEWKEQCMKAFEVMMTNNGLMDNSETSGPQPIHRSMVVSPKTKKKTKSRAVQSDEEMNEELSSPSKSPKRKSRSRKVRKYSATLSRSETPSVAFDILDTTVGTTYASPLANG